MPAPPSPPVSPGIRGPSNTILVPVFSPPTPAPSPRPLSILSQKQLPVSDPLSFNRDVLPSFTRLTAAQRREFITQLLAACEVDQLVHANALIQPRLKRDFLRELPLEVALLVLAYVDDVRTLVRAAQVSHFWHHLLADEETWKRMCEAAGYGSPKSGNGVTIEIPRYESTNGGIEEIRRGVRKLSITAGPEYNDPDEPHTPPRSRWIASKPGYPFPATLAIPRELTHQYHFKRSYLTQQNWAHGGRILRTHSSPDDGVVTSVAMDDEWIVVGLANHRINVFSTRTGLLVRTLIGHTLGVWTLGLVSRGGVMRDPPVDSGDAQVTPGALRGDHVRGFDEDSFRKTGISDVCNASTGWGQSGAIAVSGGCDRGVRVWDLTTGCLKVLDSRPIAVSGSRDTTVRVWDIARGRQTHTLRGHTDSVRCIEVSGNLAVSGSYDTTCRLWDVDTGACLRVFRGHYHEVYSVAFDGELVATGSLDSHVRIWSASSGDCLALLQGHASLVGQIQLLGNTLVTGGSDGRVIVYDTATLETVHRLSAHDNSVTCLQFDDRYVVSGGSDGYVKMYDMKTGRFIREMTSPCEAVWRVSFRDDRCVIMCRRGGRTVTEIWTFRPTDEKLL
ncbi:hypothetical protein FRC10_000837 [Ceratobasidium sp. 414]|nr:hypothetical protein FRC10_000837 [Ceratobasidium sp. 414]